MKNIRQKYPLFFLVGVILGPIILFVLTYNIAMKIKTPELTIIEPVNDSSIQVSSVLVKGKVRPIHSKVSINDIDVPTNDGYFEYNMELYDISGVRNIYIEATNKGESDSEMLTVKRIFTDEEKVRVEANKLKEEQESLAKEKAELEAYYKTPAGKICKKHTTWTRDACEKIANKEIWIGMRYEMINEMWGLPNHANESNYGTGTEWQLCWDNHTPSCFYDKDNDSLVDMYN